MRAGRERRVTAALVAGAATVLLAGCAVHSTPTDVGGEPSPGSELHARRAAVDGLRHHDERRFDAAVSRGQRATAATAWRTCAPALAVDPDAEARVTSDDAAVPDIVGVVVHPTAHGAPGCWVTLSWSEGHGWSASAERTAGDRRL
ncbi:hypothetical protein [Curtobacterium herbarum]|uniref:hypothetical protein n=1 Tax=Curtobacterium herbarum TaxID=150122 RepID=UPI0019570268|nr:hypothetical protein [Curtobacterium herbarum]MBM7476199.1 hypothetical protein [Curtobacterium herbarum]